MPKVKYVTRTNPDYQKLSEFPSFSASGSITGMKKQYYGKNALLVRSGAFIYNVSAEPEIYNRAN